MAHESGDTKGLAERIGDLVERAGGKRALAEAAGIPESLIYNYLAGRNAPNAKSLGKIAASAGVTVEWLINGDEVVPQAAPGVAAEQERLVAELQAALRNALKSNVPPSEIAHLSKALESASSALAALRKRW